MKFINERKTPNFQFENENNIKVQNDQAIEKSIRNASYLKRTESYANKILSKKKDETRCCQGWMKRTKTFREINYKSNK